MKKEGNGMLKTIRNAKGFTLVELAIVLVIIGIILGAVLKGQELINNAKAKRILSDLKGIEALVYTYMDRKGRLPGECGSNGVYTYVPAVGAVGTATAPSNNTDPTADYCATTATVETINTPWSDMRVAQILPYSTPNITLARHTMNDFFKVGSTAAIGGVVYNVIVVYGIPAWMAKAIDVSVDGSEDGAAGRFRSYVVAGGATAWPLDTANNQIVSGAYFFEKSP